MDPSRSACVAAAIAAILLSPQRSSGQDNGECLECHGKVGLQLTRDAREVSLYVDAHRLGDSLHGGLDCVDCHISLKNTKKYPHAPVDERVDCSECHEDEKGPIAAYWASTHGQRVKAGDADAPRCQDCHGQHYILPLKDPHSAVSPFNVPRMCALCHAAGAAVERTHDLPQEQVFQRYKDSIHGEGLFKQWLVVTAVCTSCHTGHNVLPHSDPRSSIHKDRVVGTCMQCHGMIEEVHRKVVAGELWERQGAVPICVECHSPHEVRKVYYDTNMSNADCLRCHADVNLKAAADARPLFVDAEKHARSVHGRRNVACAQCHTELDPSDESRPCTPIRSKANCALCHEAQVADYNRSRHGRLHHAGDANAPNCVDCHGSHDVVEHTVPAGASTMLHTLIRESPTFSRNVPTLCARCHREGAAAAVRYFGTEEHIVERYTLSIHGKGLLASGLTVTATCTDCHSPHKELPHTDPESTVSDANIAATCGKCHDGIY